MTLVFPLERLIHHPPSCSTDSSSAGERETNSYKIVKLIIKFDNTSVQQQQKLTAVYRFRYDGSIIVLRSPTSMYNIYICTC